MLRLADARCTRAVLTHLLAASPHLRPGDTSHAGRTALHSACSAGFDGIVSMWMADPHCTKVVVTLHDRKGASAASALVAERPTDAELHNGRAARDCAGRLTNKYKQKACPHPCVRRSGGGRVCTGM